MVPAIARFWAALLVACLAAISPQRETQNQTQERVWLAVEEHSRGQLIAEPIATVSGSALTPVQTSCLSDEPRPADFSARYLQPGAKYAVLVGGAHVGVAVLAAPNNAAGIARLDYSGTAKIRGQSRALATTDGENDFRAAVREPATAEQKLAALALARDIFAAHGVPQSVLSKVQAEYVTRTYLAPSPLPSLIGSFTLDTGDAEGLLHALFFVASQPEEKLSPEFVWIHLAENESDEEHLRLVDHADLFGNGQDEIIAKLVALQTQSHRYLIFRRTRDAAHWEQFFKTEPLGCFS